MTKPNRLIGGLSHRIFFEVIRTCANLPDVRQEVLKNHDNNLWWPASISDWRLRMVIAGWSTRISYNAISTYRKVVSEVEKIGYEQLCRMSDAELLRLVSPLGLFTTRTQYLRSLVAFVERLENKAKPFPDVSNDELIEVFAQEVRGASYKVAQCAVLYARGYHCGIFPVDSGMRNLLGPCLGLHLPSGPFAHEVMRKHIEGILNAHPREYYELALESGYEDLAIPKGQAPIWWAHLVMIYFKRLYCNKRNPEVCPLRANPRIGTYIGSMCDRQYPRLGGYQCIVLEGVDKVGKSTLAEELKKLGYAVIHSSYDPYHSDIVQHYKLLINNASPPVVFDRIFISEVAYGHAIRKHSRISENEYLIGVWTTATERTECGSLKSNEK